VVYELVGLRDLGALRLRVAFEGDDEGGHLLRVRVRVRVRVRARVRARVRVGVGVRVRVRVRVRAGMKEGTSPPSVGVKVSSPVCLRHSRCAVSMSHALSTLKPLAWQTQ